MKYAGEADVLEQSTRGPRNHTVTAVLVAHDGMHWLPRVRAALAASVRRPDRLVVVDTGSEDGTAEFLATGWADEVVTTNRRTGFGAAVTAGLAHAHVIDLTDGAGPGGGETIDLRDDHRAGFSGGETPIEWVWLLHDDSAPAPDALDRLLAAADRHHDADILGPKLRGWRREDVILECGVALSGTGRRETGVVSGEVDQGQHDDRLDVMAVNSAGMLVRREVWDRLGGFARTFPLLGDDADFCWRAHRAGARVIAVPDAVLYHRQALADQLRTPDATGRTLRRTNRRTAVVTALIHAPWWRLPFTAARALLGAVLRVVFHLVMLSPRRAWDDATGTIAGLLSWRAVTSGRRSERVDEVTAADLRRLRPTLAQRVIGWQESLSRHQGSQSAREAARSRRWGTAARLALVTGGLVGLVCLLATWELWFGDGRLAGGALLPAPDSATSLAQYFLAPWHDVGLGSEVPAAPYVLLVAFSAVPFLGSAVTGTQVLLLLGPVLAGLAALLALRGLVTRSTMVVASICYALLPATIAAAGTGRIGTTLAAILLPGSVRLLTRLTGIATPLPAATRRTVAGTALMTAGLASVTPALAMTLLALAVVVAVVTRHGRGIGRVLMVAVATVALLWPWSGYVLANPALLVADVGAHPAALSDEAAPVWGLAVLDPGGPTAPPAGLAAVLVLLAMAALVPSRTRRAVVAAWVLILTGLMLGIALTLVTVTLPATGTPLHPWAGPATLLAGVGAIVAVAVAAGGLRRRQLARIVLAIAVVTPVLLGGWWVTSGRTMLDRENPGVVSPYVTEASLAAEAPRTLVLRGDADRAVSYQLLSGAGPRLGDADVAPPADTVATIDRAVADLVAGGSDDAVTTLRQAAVRFVSVNGSRDAALARQLDAVPGIRRLSTLDDVVLWEIDEWRSRARALTPDGPVGLPADTSNGTLTVTGTLPAGATAVEVAQTPSPLWQATVSGGALPPAEGQWQAFQVPAGTSGDLSLNPPSGPRLVALLVPAAALVVLFGLAAARGRSPDRRRRRAHPVEPAESPADDSVGLEVLR